MVGLGRGWGRGSGVVVAPGRVLTNAHVLRGDEVAVTFADGETRLGRVAGADADLDVAVVAVDTGDAPPIAWEPDRPAQLGIGAAVLALANPGGRGLRVTFGTVSARPGARSAARAAGGSAARSSTRRRCRAARRAARWSTPTAGCSASTPCAWTAA